MNESQFAVALTADFFGPTGQPIYQDVGLSLFDQYPKICRSIFPDHRPVIDSEQVGTANGIIVMTPRVTAASIARAESLLAIGRFGVGYDAIDIRACTNADILVFITTGAVDRSVAEATAGWMIALGHNVRAKDSLVRKGQWDDRSRFMGCELRNRTLGVIGLGGIARGLIELLQSFGMNRPLAFDPFMTPAAADSAGAELVDLNTLMSRADFVSIHCPLSEQTRGLIGAQELGWMKPTSYLINTARGGIVDEDALFDALEARRIAGAAIDCFVNEPITQPHRFGELDNVLLAPHAIAWTNELFRDIGRAACQGMIDLSLGKCPRGVVNPEVLHRPGFKAKWARILQQLAGQ